MKLFTPNFTLLLLGQISSLLGNYTLRFAVSMYVLDLTGSAGVYSLIMTLSMLPTIVLSPLGGVLKLLLLAGVVSMFLAGVMLVGYPYLVRTTLGLSSGYYGVAESAAGVAAIAGAMSVGALAGRLKTARIYWLIAVAGLALVPAGIAFALPAGTIAAFVVLVASFCLAQLVCSAFSICAMTEIQRRTPERLTGKVMAFVYTLSLCAQPVGQLVYGALFDTVDAAWVLLPSAAVVLAIAFSARGFFARLDL